MTGLIVAQHLAAGPAVAKMEVSDRGAEDGVDLVFERLAPCFREELFMIGLGDEFGDFPR